MIDREEIARDKVRLYDLRKQTEEQFNLLSGSSFFLKSGAPITTIEYNIKKIQRIRQKYLYLQSECYYPFEKNEIQSVIELANDMLRFDNIERLLQLYKNNFKIVIVDNETIKETQSKQSRTNSSEYKLLVACLIFWGFIFLGAFASFSQKQTTRTVNADVSSYAYEEKIEGTANPRDRVTIYIDGEKKETVKTSLKGKWVTKGKYSGLIKVKKRKINQKQGERF